MKASIPVLGLAAFWLSACAATAQVAEDRTNLYPRLVPQMGHGDLVQRVVVSKSGKLLLTGGNDSTARLWDTATGRIVRTIPGLPVGIFACALTEDERSTIVSSNDSSVRVIACDTGIELPLFPQLGARVTGLCVSPDDKIVMAGGLNGSVMWVDVATGKEIHRHEGQDITHQVLCTAFSPDGVYCAAGRVNKTALVWRTSNWSTVLELKVTEELNSLKFSSDGKLIYGGCSDGTVLTCSLPGGKLISEIKAAPNPVTGENLWPENGIVAITEQVPGKRLLCGNKSGWWFECDLENRMVKNMIHCEAVLPSAVNARSMDISQDGNYIFTGHDDGAVRRWKADGKSPPMEFHGFSNRVADFAVTPDLSAIVTIGTDGTVSTWISATGALTKKFKLEGADSCVVAPDASWIAVSQNGALVQHSLDDGRVLRRMETGAGAISAIALSPDGKYLASGDLSNVVSIWNASTGNRVVWYLSNYGPGDSIGLTESGQRVLKDPRFQGHQGITSIAFSKDNNFVVTGGDLSARLWKTDSELEIRRFLGHSRPVETVGISPDGKIIATGTAENELVLWNAADGSELHRLKGHASAVTSVDFSPDNSRVVTSSHDGSALLWNPTTGVLIKRLGPFGGFQGKVKFAQQGKFIVCSSVDSGISIWNGVSGDHLCTLNAGRDGSWICSAPEGRFDSSNLDSIDGIQWVMPDSPLRPMSPEVFMRDYYEPKLLPRLLTGEKFKEVRSLQNLNRAQPTVSITSIRPAAKPDHVDIDVQITSATYPVQREGVSLDMRSGVYDLRLFRDGRLVAQYPPVKDDAPVLEEGNSEAQLAAWRAATRAIERAEAGQSGEVRRTISFKDIRLPAPKAAGQGAPSTVEWTAYGFNEDRVKSTTAREAYTLKQGSVSRPKPKAYLLGIGVSSYESPAFNLQFADDDARMMIETLGPRLQKCGYEVVAEVLVSDLASDKWQATKGATREAMGRLAAAVTPDDLVMVSFSSHGYTDTRSNEFYLLPSDIGQGRSRDQAPDPALLSRCISGEELSRWMRRIDAGEMLLVIDACHSAAVVEQPWFKPGPMGSRGLGQLAYDKRMRVLAASQANDYAIEASQASGIGQGLLTYALTTDGLEDRRADHKPKDGRIGLGEWLAWGVQRVPEVHQTLRSQRAVTQLAKGVQEKSNLIILKAAGDGAMTRQFVAEDEDDLKDSSLAEDRPAQTPQLFDFAPKGPEDPVLEYAEKP